ncbi:site-specific integrase [Clostridium sp.]|uniref:site-specific integrase n=1 Tax=Clostridium sp. TaxID=1506 RepID=UPI003D6D39AD
MSKTIYKKKVKNDKEYYFYRLRHKNLKKPKDMYAATVKELDAKIKAVVNELDHGISNNKEYLGVFFKDWLYDTHLIDKKPSTKQRYDSIYRTYIDDSSIYTIKLKDLSPSDIQIFYKELISIGKSKAAISMLHKLIAPCIRYAYDNNRIIKDFSRAIIIPKESEEKKLSKASDVKPFTLEQQINFIEVIKGHDLEVLFIAAIDTGLRQGELFALTWKDIDLDDASISVNKSYKVIKNIDTGEYEGIVQTPKTKKSIRIVISYLKRL